jgi:hypothetical protein
MDERIQQPGVAPGGPTAERESADGRRLVFAGRFARLVPEVGRSSIGFRLSLGRKELSDHGGQVSDVSVQLGDPVPKENVENHRSESRPEVLHPATVDPSSAAAKKLEFTRRALIAGETYQRWMGAVLAGDVCASDILQAFWAQLDDARDALLGGP